MAFLFGDTFSHYATADLTTKWTQAYVPGAFSTTAPAIGATGRHGSNGVTFTNTILGRSSQSIGLTLSPSGNKIVFGAAVKTGNFANMGTGTNDSPLDDVLSATVFLYVRRAGSTQFWIRIDNTGTLSVYRGSTLLGTTSATLSPGTFSYIEVEAVANTGTSGSVAIYMNTVQRLNVTGVNTANTGSAGWNEIVIGHLFDTTFSGQTMTYCDVTVADGNATNADGTTSTWTAAKQQDIRGDAYFPTSDGADTDFSLSTGSLHYANVNETVADGDTKYNYSAVSGAKDTFGFNAIPASTIFGIQATTQARKTDGGAANHAAVARIGGVDYVGQTNALSTSYTFVRQCWDTAPSSSGAWTTTSVNASQFGYERP